MGGFYEVYWRGGLVNRYSAGSPGQAKDMAVDELSRTHLEFMSRNERRAARKTLKAVKV